MRLHKGIDHRMNQYPQGRIYTLPNKKIIVWALIECGLIVLGSLIGICAVNLGPDFLAIFVYPIYHPKSVSDAVLINYFAVTPSLIVSILVWGVSRIFKTAWWKPLGFIVGCIGVSIWWVGQINYYSYFISRP